MPVNRKNFIKHSAAALIGSVTFNKAASADFLLPVPALPESMGIVDPNDEQYWQLVRQQFPLTKDVAYLNNGTMGPSPYPVIEAVRKGMMDCDMFGNYGGWEATSGKLAKFVGANEDEIALTHNVTDGINIACWGLPLKKDDEVILTTHEHVGNALPWLNRRRVDGIVIKVFTPASTADETLNRITALYTKKTRAVAVPHIPCTQGQILPVKEICKWAKEKGIYAVIDGAHGPGMMPLDLHDMGCDTYASCCHKWMLGPKGTGFLYVRKDFMETLQPYFVGGGSDNAKWNMALKPIPMGEYANNAHRYYGGTQASGLYKGVDAAIDFIDSIGIENIHNRIKTLGKYVQDHLLSFGDKIELITPTEERSRCAVNGFRIKGVEYTKFYTMAAENKIRIRSVAENGLNSLRVSTHIYNNKQEIDKLMQVVANALKG
ncbi:MAG: aminotransferase class V-fold PLP-dependent enzyme [Bacteroidia bacterium]|nr:aminotransferase class V-fold PLP-dependent enzyme [Bacteroidia bacterium]